MSAARRRDDPETISAAVRRRAGQDAELRGLRRRFVLAISTLVAVVLVAQTAMLAIFGSRHLRDEIEGKASSYSVLAAAPACDAYQTYFDSGFSKFRELILELLELNSDLERFEIYDVEGVLRFRSDEIVAGGHDDATLDATAAGERLLAAVRGLDVQSWRGLSESGDERFTVVVPWVEEWGRHRYSVAFLFSYRSLARARFETLWQLFALALFALAVGVVCAYLLSSQSLGPVARLTQGARKLAEGDLRHRISLRTGDEFEVLGATLDHMAERLAVTIEDLEASNRELRELDQMKSDLLANVSHELRTPLTAISGYVEAMREGLLGELGDEHQNALEVMERNLQRLRTMIDQLLGYSRMESGRLEVELAAFDLDAVARQVAESVTGSEFSDSSRVELRYDCPPDLPEAYGDAGRIGQVIDNLLTNAVKFSPGGGRVELAIREVDAGVEVRVSDQGIGIPEELQQKIFDRFYQIDASSKRHYGGIGLGLALVQEILELHHSKIEVESSPGAGSSFAFVLPLAAERSGLQNTRRVKQVGEPGEPAPPQVVIIDDDPGFVREMTAHLGGHGFAVDAVATAAQGLALARRLRPDVIVLDRLLPDEDGFDLLSRFQKLKATRDIPVVLASVRKEKALGLRRGAAAYLRKPLEPAILERTLIELLEARDRP